MKPRVILDSKHLAITIDRLCQQLIENHGDFSKTCIIGIQPRGIFLSDRIVKRLTEKLRIPKLRYGKLDVTFYRDDFRRSPKLHTPKSTAMDFSIEEMDTVLIDDVLFTGRTVRSALDALLDFGRPRRVELMVLIDRRFSRHVPVQADYCGKSVDAVSSEYVSVEWQETHGLDKVLILEARKGSK